MAATAQKIKDFHQSIDQILPLPLDLTNLIFSYLSSCDILLSYSNRCYSNLTCQQTQPEECLYWFQRLFGMYTDMGPPKNITAYVPQLPSKILHLQLRPFHEDDQSIRLTLETKTMSRLITFKFMEDGTIQYTPAFELPRKYSSVRSLAEFLCKEIREHNIRRIVMDFHYNYEILGDVKIPGAPLFKYGRFEEINSGLTLHTEDFDFQLLFCSPNITTEFFGYRVLQIFYSDTWTR